MSLAGFIQSHIPSHFSEDAAPIQGMERIPDGWGLIARLRCASEPEPDLNNAISGPWISK
jgi:hypothetical protein